MTQTQSNRMLLKRLSRLNKTIDRRIIEGRSYRREAKQHKELLAQLRQPKKSGWSVRLASSMAMFL